MDGRCTLQLISVTTVSINQNLEVVTCGQTDGERHGQIFTYFF